MLKIQELKQHVSAVLAARSGNPAPFVIPKKPAKFEHDFEINDCKNRYIMTNRITHDEVYTTPINVIIIVFVYLECIS